MFSTDIYTLHRLGKTSGKSHKSLACTNLVQLPIDISVLNEMESAILNSKMELSRISESRWKAILAKDERAALKARVEAAEKTLEGCRTITTYLENFSTPIARGIQKQQESVAREFERVRYTKDPSELHGWMKMRLFPLVNSSERMAHVVASSTSRMRGLDIDFHKWTASMPTSSASRNR